MQQLQLCQKCFGNKKLFKLGNAYSLADMGGTPTTCYSCKGEGKIRTLEAELQHLKDKNKDVTSDEKKESTGSSKTTKKRPTESLQS